VLGDVADERLGRGRGDDSLTVRASACIGTAAETSHRPVRRTPIARLAVAQAAPRPADQHAHCEQQRDDPDAEQRIAVGGAGPGRLVRRTAPATMTGILDRLERGGWIDRDRHPSERRGVVVRAARGQGAEVLRLYVIDSRMNTAMEQICVEYEDEDLEVLAGFRRRTADAVRTAAEKPAGNGAANEHGQVRAQGPWQVLRIDLSRDCRCPCGRTGPCPGSDAPACRHGRPGVGLHASYPPSHRPRAPLAAA